jgi:hypothetical protein
MGIYCTILALGTGSQLGPLAITGPETRGANKHASKASWGEGEEGEEGDGVLSMGIVLCTYWDRRFKNRA